LQKIVENGIFTHFGGSKCYFHPPKMGENSEGIFADAVKDNEKDEDE